MNDKIEAYLKKSANIAYDVSNKLCKNGIVDTECLWYHSVWQYLRLLNVVSSPTWHDEFYNKELLNALNNKLEANILISGTADYSMLAYVIYAIEKSNVKKPHIYVLDTCNTPLYLCKWYAKNNNVVINTINQNIMLYENKNFYDIICTDAFLTRFSKDMVSKVISKWSTLLKKNGKIITTIRVHYDNESKITNDEINNFADKVKYLAEKNKEYIKLKPIEIAKLTKNYARKMKSNNIGNEKDIINFFNSFNIHYNIKILCGELRESKYIELVAEKINN